MDFAVESDPQGSFPHLLHIKIAFIALSITNISILERLKADITGNTLMLYLKYQL